MKRTVSIGEKTGRESRVHHKTCRGKGSVWSQRGGHYVTKT